MGKIAFVFAGQGAQFVGMGKDLYDSVDNARKVFDMAGRRVRDLCFAGPAEELGITVNTQPCLFAMDLACARALEERGIKAEGVAGFSLGEIPAVAFAGLLSEAEAFKLVNVRAGAMQECAERRKGAMFAVLKLSAGETESICANLQEAYPVNYNCPGQTVVACAEETAPALAAAVTLAGGKALKLQVSGAFHSPFMAEATDKLHNYLCNLNFQPSSLPMYSNVTGHTYGEPKELLTKQVCSPVRWQEMVEAMISDGFDTFIEVGPGKTLTGLIKKINGSVKTANVFDTASLDSIASEVRNA